MTLPNAVTKTHLDSGADDPAQARVELAAGLDAINALITHLGTSTLTSGSAVASATGGLEVSSGSLRTALSFLGKSAGYTAVAGDRGRVINFTTAGVTLALTAAATLGDGWWCIAANAASSGVVTIDPNGAETIDGATTITLQPGEACLIICSGTLFRTVGRRPAADYFSAHKNGSNQGSITNGNTHKITFGSEEADTAGVFDTSTSRFVPPAGQRWHLAANIQTTDGSDGMILTLHIYKNGSAYKDGQRIVIGVATSAGAGIAGVIVEGNGTDYYEVHFSLGNSVATRTIDGTAARTWFTGHRLG